MSDELEKLRQEIWKNPDDASLLAVYADALTASDPTRAEYMQLGLLGRTRSPKQQKRLVALRNKHRGAWLGAARKHVWTWQEDPWRPGFISKVNTAMARFNAGFEHLRKLGPKLVVTITAPKSRREIEAFAALPLSSIHGFEFYEDGSTKMFVNDFLLDTIGPSLRGVMHLALSASSYGATRGAIEALLQNLVGLERLALTGDDELFPSLAALERAPFKRTLRRLATPYPFSKRDQAKLRRIFPNCDFRSDPFESLADD